MQQQGYVTEALPRFLEVAAFSTARQQETVALADALKSSDGGRKFGIQANPRQLRRRTGAYNTFKHNLRPNTKKFAKRRRLEDSPTFAGQEEAQEQDHEGAKLESRAMRRRRGRLQARFEASAADNTGGQGLRRLETHVWHAKRMQMKQRWGHVLAEGLVGKGHGSRALLHKLQQGTIMHDASYCCPLQLSGQGEGLLSVIASCSCPMAAQSLRLDEAFLAGCKEHQGMLHHPGSFPTRAISPMTMLMSPLASAAGEKATGFGQVERQLLVFIHAAAATEGEAALRAACRRQGVTLEVRLSDLRRIELRGMGADAALAAALSLPNCDELSENEHSWRDLIKKDQAGKGFERLPDGSALSIRVRDPRLARPMQIAGQQDPHAEQAGQYALPASAPASSSFQGTQTPMLQSVADSRPPPISGIWSPGAAPPAISEKQVSGMRRQARKDALHLCFPPQTGKAAQEQEDPLCPLVAIRRSGLPSNPTSWSLILPRGWVCLLWNALAFTGATPAGQREWRWVAQQYGAGFFPHDFPDTRAAAEMVAMLTAEDNALRQLRPNGRYPDATATGKSILGTACEKVKKTDKGEEPAAYRSPDAQGCSAQAQAGPDSSAPQRKSMELSGNTDVPMVLPREDLMPAFLRLTPDTARPGVGRDPQGAGSLRSVSRTAVPDRLVQQSGAALGPHHSQPPAAAHNDAVAAHLASDGGSGPAMQPVCLTLTVHPTSGVCTVGLHLRDAEMLDVSVGTAALPASLRPQPAHASGLLAEGCYAARSLDTLRAGLTGSPLMAVSAPQSVPHLIWQPRRAHSSAAGAIGDADPKCMVRVRLQLLGRGTVEDGAAILAPRQPALGPGEEAAIGLCTSSAPRGLAGKRGASAVCSAKALWQLAAAWPAQLPKNGKLGPVRVLVKNPRSTVLRPAIAMCWIELPEGDRLM